jgi:hypothetical protein
MGQAEAAFGVGEAGATTGFGARLLGAVRLDPDVWDEIAADTGALGQAGLVVAAAAAASYVASGPGVRSTVLATVLGSLVSWLGLSGLLWAVANWFRHRLGIGAALRVVGFAMAPLVGLALAAIPVDVVQGVVRLVTFALFLGALVVGTRQALGVETARAGLVCFTAALAGAFAIALVLALAPAPA